MTDKLYRYLDEITDTELRLSPYHYGAGQLGVGVQITLDGRTWERITAVRLPASQARQFAEAVLRAVHDPASPEPARQPATIDGAATDDPDAGDGTTETHSGPQGAVSDGAVLAFLVAFVRRCIAYDIGTEEDLVTNLDELDPEEVDAVRAGLEAARQHLSDTATRAARERDSLARRLSVRFGELEEARAALRQAGDDRDKARNDLKFVMNRREDDYERGIAEGRRQALAEAADMTLGAVRAAQELRPDAAQRAELIAEGRKQAAADILDHAASTGRAHPDDAFLLGLTAAARIAEGGGDVSISRDGRINSHYDEDLATCPGSGTPL